MVEEWFVHHWQSHGHGDVHYVELYKKYQISYKPLLPSQPSARQPLSIDVDPVLNYKLHFHRNANQSEITQKNNEREKCKKILSSYFTWHFFVTFVKSIQSVSTASFLYKVHAISLSLFSLYDIWYGRWKGLRFVSLGWVKIEYIIFLPFSM